MQSYTPAEDAKTATARREAVELCGKNRGPHDLIPIEWAMTATNKRVTVSQNVGIFMDYAG